MKYMRLTKEQLEELHPEFGTFLAAQAIDKAEWEKIKAEQPEAAERQLDVFSDLIWEGALREAEYMEHFSGNAMFLFHCEGQIIKVVAIKATASAPDFLTQEGVRWLENNIHTANVEIQVGEKKTGTDKNLAVFEIIRQGGVLSDGNLYKQVKKMINL